MAIHRTGAFVRAYESGMASLTVDELDLAANVLGTTCGEVIAEYERG
jgi:hypothetical protein